MLAAASILVLDATAQATVRGLRKAEWAAYAVAEDGSFQCRDGSATKARLNDDYCDCTDGSDEPGTSACPNSRFFCANKGFKSKEVFSSMVNDGVCDCCDGSDEWQTGVCQNDCLALGAAAKAKAEERARLVAKGYEIATQWAARGEAARQTTQAELEALNQELEGKRQEVAAIEEKKKAAEEVEQQLQEEHRVKKEAEAEAARVQAEAEKAEADAAAAAAGEEEPPQEGAEAAAPEAMQPEAEAAPAEAEAEAEAAPGEEEAASPAEEYEAAEGELPDEGEDYGEGGGEEEEEEAPAAPAAEPEEPLPTDPEAEKLRGEHRDAKDALRKLEDKERELKEALAKDYGGMRQYEPLQHECFDVTQGEWIYSLCPYKDAKQKGKHGGGSTDLGRWDGWADGYKKMEFKHGQACWNGPIRSLDVHVRCGGESKLLKVDEPEVCKYVAEFETPGACTEEDARLAQLEVESCAADDEE